MKTLTSSLLLPLVWGALVSMSQGQIEAVPSSLQAPAEAASPASDPDLPSALDPATLQEMVQASPFTRAVNPSDSLILTGIAFIDGKPVATIFDTEKKQSHIVSEKANFQGWILQEAMPAADMRFAQVKVSIGGEVVSIRYDKDAMAPDKMKRDKRQDGGAPPPPAGDSFRKPSRGPSEEDRKRYESLSDSAREKFRNVLRERFSDPKFRDAPEEDRRAFLKSTFEKIEKEDQSSRKR
ncbi:MAG: hypothetical protein KDK97_09230 [Verrucomicrobiales bacterium]|nr:hypothetical protein [Verrucomicrobiales bacterium]MCP5557353.1 hypothetical protein [Verrucomicrobiaceae bacterium]